MVLAPLSWFDDWIWEVHAPVWVNLGWFIAFTFLFPVYSIVLHGRYGQTIGKRLCGVRVVDISERPLTWVQAALRDLPNLIYPSWALVGAARLILAGLDPYPTMPSEADLQGIFLWNMWVAVELLTTLTNSKRCSIHDFLARSVVVRVEPS